ncbi:MAG: DNA-3-methyladenine glycosylase, partial [Anaerolineales bacterium]|nr:DNA-3-methyladenine glycosylase [Anaerolineales bacterium]
MARAPLQRSFFDRPTLDVAEDILGALLVRALPSGRRLSGWVTEAEAYIGSEDQACHARHGRTNRNAPMWGP